MWELVEQRGLSRYFEVFCETVYYAGKFFGCFEITDKTFLQQYNHNNKASKGNLWTVFIQNVNNRKSIEEASNLKDLINSFVIPDKEEFLPKYAPFLTFFKVTPYKIKENSKIKYVDIDAIIKAINDKLFSTSQVRNNDFISYGIKKYYGSSNTNSSWVLYNISNYLVEPFQIVEFNFPEIFNEDFIPKNSAKSDESKYRHSNKKTQAADISKFLGRTSPPQELIDSDAIVNEHWKSFKKTLKRNKTDFIDDINNLLENDVTSKLAKAWKLSKKNTKDSHNKTNMDILENILDRVRKR